MKGKNMKARIFTALAVAATLGTAPTANADSWLYPSRPPVQRLDPCGKPLLYGEEMMPKPGEDCPTYGKRTMAILIHKFGPGSDHGWLPSYHPSPSVGSDLQDQVDELKSRVDDLESQRR
jgi:hypothetical protein